ncbi:hypothetical protein [Fodinicurvata sediminis]|uniref:hypothetical protein n=1 Tax=Fodinicurvata sediminis TaxID=1121832 RepID=UPI0003B324F8|nr:hypothetical protein [Fodinicurvata sediminis]
MSWKAIAGGALAGLGEGLAQRTAAKREAALAAAKEARRQRERLQERQWDLEDQKRERAWEQEDAQADLKREKGLLSFEHDLRRETATHEASLGSSGSGGGSSEDPLASIEMSAGEKRTYDELKERYTDELGGTDWNALIQHMRNMEDSRGGERWSAIADYLSAGGSRDMTPRDAREQAEMEASERAPGFFGSDEDAWEGAGSKEAWVERRANEILGRESASGGQQQSRGLMSNQQQGEQRAPAGRDQGSQAGGSGAGSGTGQKGTSASKTPPGQGSRSDPYKATTQAHIDWFKANAAAGAVIEVDGELFTK